MAKKKEILFGGQPEIPSEAVFAEVRSKWSPEWKIFNAAIDQFRKSPDNNGLIPDDGSKPATLEQVWNFFTMMGSTPYCLLSVDQPEVPTGRIEKVIKMTSHQLVEALKQISADEGHLYACLLHYDGKTGHCINVSHYNAESERFIYRDPWPLDSLLCSKNNEAGVNAVQEVVQGEGKLWSVTPEELERVVFAVFIMPPVWERMQHNLAKLSLDNLKSGRDFFDRFVLRELAQYEHGDEKEVQYSPGAFKGIVIVSFNVDKANRIDGVKLLMLKQWMVQNLNLAFDIARQLLKQFVPDQDRAKYDEIIESLYVQKMRELLPELVQRESNRTLRDEVLLAFTGKIEKASFPCNFSSLSIENVAQNEAAGVEVTLRLP